MGHGKETPRQKMIGMMYLVLTAMLAMNVSVEVLDAFTLVDEGLTLTTKNYKIKNKQSYNELDFFYTQNEAKVRPWKEKADSVKDMSQELLDFVHELKLVILAEAGEDEAVIDGEIHGKEIAGKSNTDTGGRIMDGTEPGTGRGKELQQKIEEFKHYVVSCIQNPEKDSTLVTALEKLLDTHDPPPTEDGIHHSWVSEHFAHIPLAAVMPMMTKVQVDVLNAESEIINYLTNQVNEGGLNVNSIQATVIQNSDYILQGNEYKAQVFIAAFDTTQDPEVLVGRYDSTRNEMGGWEYSMVGNYEQLPVENGKGILVRTERSLGTNKWGGLIRIKKDDGTYYSKPFKASYTVEKSQTVVSASKMNVFYRGVENPLRVSVPGVDPTAVEISVSSGTYRRDGVGYIVVPAQGQVCNVNVYARIDGQRRSMGTEEFRIKPVPDPFPQVINLPKNEEKFFTKNKIPLVPGLEAAMPPDFDFDLEFKITKFTVTMSEGGLYKSLVSNSNAFTKEQKDLMNTGRPKGMIMIENIEAVGPSGSVRQLNDIIIKFR